MENVQDKSNNEILLMIKQYEMEHQALKLSMVKDFDTIEALKKRMKTNWEKLEEVEKDFNEASSIITRRLKGEI